MPRLSIEVLDETRRLPEAALAWLIRHAERAVRRVGGQGEVRVRIVGDEAMAAAHEEFAGVPGTTDVLTFDMSEPVDDGPEAGDRGGEEDGERSPPPLPTLDEIRQDNVRSSCVLDTDILVCIDEAERQSTARGYPCERELLLYTLHGVLHCIGFDDHEEADFEAMHGAEDAVLAAIGVGPVFHRPYVAGDGPGEA
ncbi:MAG: rRNA maturation RNase YbeY [Phycisphaerales bacterium]|jgi:probable rRNA maturation factor